MTENVSPSLREAIEAAVAADEASAAPAAEQARDEAGRFAGAPPEVETAPEAPAPEEPDDYDEGVGLDRETWKLTPAQARERAKALAKEAREASERAKQYEPVERVLAARRDALRATYGDEGRALEQLFHLSDWAGRDFHGFVQHLAQQRGVDLRTLVPQPADQQQPQTYEQLVAAAREEARRAAAEEYEQRKISSALQDFESNTAFEFRHEPEIRRVMAGLIQSGAATDYATAYTMAAKAHPTISAKLAERERADAAKRESEEAARRAREKASAAVSVRGAPGTSAPAAAAAPTNVRAAVLAAIEQHGGRI
jgi:hypothetical protein